MQNEKIPTIKLNPKIYKIQMMNYVLITTVFNLFK